MKTEDNIITGCNNIRKALCMPTSFPNDELKPLIPIGSSKFKSDNFDGILKSWSVNDKFDIGKTYPVYENDSNLFVVGNDGIGYKMTPIAWTKVKFLN